MLRLDILQDQWLLLALGGGLVLVLAFAVAYLGYWRKPSGQADAAGRRPVPWILILVYVAIPVFAAIYLILHAMNPPNW
jgi:hypothetical protein